MLRKWNETENRFISIGAAYKIAMEGIEGAVLKQCTHLDLVKNSSHQCWQIQCKKGGIEYVTMDTVAQKNNKMFLPECPEICPFFENSAELTS